MTRRGWSWLRCLAGAAIVVALVWRLGTDAFVDGLRLVDTPAVLAALGIGVLTTVFSAGRWCLVARGLGLRLPLTTAVADYYRGLFLNVVLPAGVLGDADRAVRHGRRSGDVGRGVRAVVLERVGGQMVLIVVGVAMLFLQPILGWDTMRTALPGPGALVVPVTLAVVVAALAAWLRWGGGAARCRRALATVVTDTRRGLLSRGTWPGVVLLSAAALAGNVGLFLVAARTAGTAAPLVELVPLLVLALLVMSLPLNVGGWGPREAFLAFAFGAAGLGAAQGLTAAVVCGVLTFVATLPGAAVLLLRRATRDRAARVQDPALDPAPESESHLDPHADAAPAPSDSPESRVHDSRPRPARPAGRGGAGGRGTRRPGGPATPGPSRPKPVTAGR